MKTKSRQQAWGVYLGDREIDVVFYNHDCDANYVRSSLIDHDGYPLGIEVYRK